MADDAKAGGSSDMQHSEQRLDEPSQSYVLEPETESENAESVTYSDHQAAGDQQQNHSKAASVTSVDQEQDVAELETGMQNVRIEEPMEDAGDDARSNSSHTSAQSHHNLRHSTAES